MNNDSSPSRFVRSAYWSDRASEILSGGISSDIRSRHRYFPLYFRRGVGAHIEDVDGNDYVDHVLGHGPLVLGHAPAQVLEAVREQIMDGSLFGGGSELEVLTAERIRSLVPCAERVRFGTTGSEAVHAALRLARAATGRSKIVRFEGHYHGWYDNILWSYLPPLDKAGPRNNPHLVSFSEGVPPEEGANLIPLPWNDLDCVRDLFRRKGNEIAAVITEPVMHSCGAIPPQPGYLEGLREVCDQWGALLLFDEVVTGFRLALGGAQERFGVLPDLAVFGKALGAGFPISCLAGKESTMRHWGKGGALFAGTFNANVLSLAATNACLDVLTDPETRPLESMKQSVGDFERFVESLRTTENLPIITRGVAPMLHISFLPEDAAPVTDYRSFLQTDLPSTDQFHLELLDEGVYALPSWFFSAAHTQEDFNRTRNAVLGVLRKGTFMTHRIGEPQRNRLGVALRPFQEHRKLSTRRILGGLKRRMIRTFKTFSTRYPPPLPVATEAETECDALFAEFEQKVTEFVEFRRRTPAPNFYWGITWETTQRCNLACSYCPQEHAGLPDEQLEKGFQAVLAAQPRFLWVSGGEPTLLRELPGMLRTIREQTENPWIVVNTNFMSPITVYEEWAEVVDAIYVSLDGIGEDNWKNRGFNGRKLLDKLARFVASHKKLAWAVNTVVNDYNLNNLADFTHEVQRRTPGLVQNFWAMCPNNAYPSIASDDGLIHRFSDIMKSLQSQYPHIRFSIPPLGRTDPASGRHTHTLERPLRDEELAVCPRQFFVAEVKTDGEIYDCGARQISGLAYLAGKARDENNAEDLRRVIELIEKQRDRSSCYNPHCSHPCTWWDGLDRFLYAKSTDDPGLSSFPEFAGKFRPEDRRRAAEFIQSNVNPAFEAAFFDYLGNPNRLRAGNRIQNREKTPHA